MDGLLFNKRMLDALSRCTGQSFYVMDYPGKCFPYVSPSPLFLCGHKVEEVLEKGFSYYEEVLPEEDMSMLLDINERGIRLFHELPVESRGYLVISLDFRLRQKGKRLLMVNHKLTPITLTPEGELHYALCFVNLSTSDLPGNAFVCLGNELRRYLFEDKRSVEDSIIVLSEREREVLQLSAEGYGNEEISHRIFADVNTVKYHKSKLYEQFGVKNIAEAILFAENNWLI